jgi:hypothetical protein
MHFRRIVCLFLGVWFGGTVVVAVEASYSHRAAERILVEPAVGALQHIHAMGREGAREFVRYAAAEQIRWLRETWDSVQVVLGAVLFFLLLFGSSEGKFGLMMAFGMLGLAIFDRFVLTPEIAALGRLSDFIPPGSDSGDRARALMLEGGYVGLEVVKWVLGLGLAASLVLRHQYSAARGHVPAKGSAFDVRRAR